jgi:hypothetical protein
MGTFLLSVAYELAGGVCEMKSPRVDQNAAQSAGGKWFRAVQVAAIGLLLATALPMSAQEKKDSGAINAGKSNKSVGFIASKDASAKEVGLPLYPGARPHQDKSDDSPAFQLGLWGGAWGFKIVALKLESNDSPEKVAAFYQKALAKYGRVWNCADSAKAASEQEKTDSPHELKCQDTKPESGETVLKAGTKEKQHIVDIKPDGGLSIIQLVSVELPPSDSSK